eukprot:gene26689-biopygen17153
MPIPRGIRRGSGRIFAWNRHDVRKTKGHLVWKGWGAVTWGG